MEYRGAQQVREDIYAMFRHELAKLGDRGFPTSRLLVRHWLDYLRGQQMIPFDKLESDDFDYLNLPKDEQRHLMASAAHSRAVPDYSIMSRAIEVLNVVRTHLTIRHSGGC